MDLLILTEVAADGVLPINRDKVKRTEKVPARYILDSSYVHCMP